MGGTKALQRLRKDPYRKIINLLVPRPAINFQDLNFKLRRKRNKQLLQTLQIDNACSKKMSCIKTERSYNMIDILFRAMIWNYFQS